jgi:hypothetical protein
VARVLLQLLLQPSNHANSTVQHCHRKSHCRVAPEVLTAIECSTALASRVGGQASTALLTAGSVPAHVVGGNCAQHARVSDDTSGSVPCGLAPIAWLRKALGNRFGTSELGLQSFRAWS